MERILFRVYSIEGKMERWKDGENIIQGLFYMPRMLLVAKVCTVVVRTAGGLMVPRHSSVRPTYHLNRSRISPCAM
jgi:hypothetical protein